ARGAGAAQASRQSSGSKGTTPSRGSGVPRLITTSAFGSRGRAARRGDPLTRTLGPAGCYLPPRERHNRRPERDAPGRAPQAPAQGLRCRAVQVVGARRAEEEQDRVERAHPPPADRSGPHRHRESVAGAQPADRPRAPPRGPRGPGAPPRPAHRHPADRRGAPAAGRDQAARRAQEGPAPLARTRVDIPPSPGGVVVEHGSEVRLSKVGFIMLGVKDVQAALPFYRDVLGLTVKWALEDLVFLDAGGVVLVLRPAPAAGA